MYEKSEYQLIKEAASKNDAALMQLMKRYEPIINTVKKRYYIRSFDDNDWLQEALIICYESCCSFDFDLNKNFGAYFKTKLTNYAKSLLRYQMAKRRGGRQQPVSYDTANESGMINEEGVEMAITPIAEIYKKYINNLSLIELSATLLILGVINQEYACKMAGCTELQLTRAKARCKKKFEGQLK